MHGRAPDSIPHCKSAAMPNLTPGAPYSPSSAPLRRSALRRSRSLTIAPPSVCVYQTIEFCDGIGAQRGTVGSVRGPQQRRASTSWGAGAPSQHNKTKCCLCQIQAPKGSKACLGAVSNAACRAVAGIPSKITGAPPWPPNLDCSPQGCSIEPEKGVPVCPRATSQSWGSSEPVRGGGEAEEWSTGSS